MTAKSNIRSIRFTNELYDLIDRQNGDTFTQKLENLVTTCVWELPAKQKELKQIQDQIAHERQELRQIRQNKQKIEEHTRNLRWELERAGAQVKRLVDAMEKTEL